ncbi:ArnT family glycosyltransferase [Streptomyces sp. NPDC051561]|uniref:ArnT family glycosyltransferase n=1 Tax=Streptomyces sp. NPDC051561 TaxID=3365658 RepID=UPI0037920F5E
MNITQPPTTRTGGVPRGAATGTDRAAYWLRTLPLLALLAAVTRVPSFLHPLWNPDEGFLAVQARQLAAGGVLYDTVVDRKPPLVPWLYEAVFALFGDDSLLPLKLLAVLALFATAALLASLARRRWGDRSGTVAGVLFLLISVGMPPEDTQAASFGLFMLPCTALAVWCADRGAWTCAGVAVAAAFLVKQTGGAVLVPVLWLIWRTAGASPGGAVPGGAVETGGGQGSGGLSGARSGARPEASSGERPGSRPSALLRTGLGFAVPVAAVALVTGPSGFLFWVVTGSGSYADLTGAGLHALGRGLGNTLILAGACIGLLIPLLRRPKAPGADLWIWLAASAVAVMTGFHFFGHYYLQLMPPLALLATAALNALPHRWTTLSLALTAATCAGFLVWGFLAPRPELAHAGRLADAIRSRTAPTERVLIWGMHPETYWLADRTPASRYLTAGLLTNFSGGRGDGAAVGEPYGVEGSWDHFRAELAAHPPALIVDDSRGKPYTPDRLPTLRKVLERDYVPAGTIDGAVLYVRSGTSRSGTSRSDAARSRPGPAVRPVRYEAPRTAPRTPPPVVAVPGRR